MKKQRSNNKFLKIAAVSLALLALPPLAVYGQTVRCRAAQPRPALPGVMSDEIRLDPVAGALYRYRVQGGQLLVRQCLYRTARQAEAGRRAGPSQPGAA